MDPDVGIVKPAKCESAARGSPPRKSYSHLTGISPCPSQAKNARGNQHIKQSENLQLRRVNLIHSYELTTCRVEFKC
ncbi:hypothetical protein EVAR_57248_1 [Eumeta japonica]|uniref:Uncharacterized protein n=1 Tax=Eumeta variegata TaxID=151549 RepID=A0A4C1YQY5_EUMVA|nr:hypothetical protein EVAR_57248_1 [Eumeta japonica]